MPPRSDTNSFAPPVDPLLADPALLDALYLGQLRRGDIHAPINTLDNLAMELEAGRTFLTRPHAAPYLHGQRWHDWATRQFP